MANPDLGGIRFRAAARMSALDPARSRIGKALRLGAYALTVVGAARIAARRFASVTVAGRSMEPSLRDGDRLLAWRTPRRLRVGDIVVLEAPAQLRDEVAWPQHPALLTELNRRWLVKRVAALAGDPVPAGTLGAVVAEETVPAQHLLVLGDNPVDSYDSRFIGYVPADRIFGVVVGRLPTTR